MENNISDAIKLCIELIVTAALIGVVGSFAFVSHSAYGTLEHNRSNRSIMEDKTILYDCDNKVVTGSDILDNITKNVRLYKFTVVTKDGTYVIDIENENKRDAYGKKYGLRLWSVNYIRDEVLGANMFNKFYAELEYNKTRDLIVGVKFIQEGVI